MLCNAHDDMSNFSIRSKHQRCYRVLLSVEGAVGDPAKVSPRGYHESHSSQSLFQLFFLLLLVDSEAAESTVTNFLRHTTISQVLSDDA